MYRFGLLLTLPILSIALLAGPVAASEWQTLTIDNDLFVGNDDGYTNGLFFSNYEIQANHHKVELPEWIVPFALVSETNTDDYSTKVYAQTIGQIMMTPQDINVANPEQGTVPYSGLLFLNQSVLNVKAESADKYSATIGIVGPASLAGDSQKIIHSALDSDDPKGWGTQLDNEIVFSLSRGKAWRSWTSPKQKADLVTMVDGQIGTIESFVRTGITLRYGEHLDNSYASSLLAQSRASNPVSANGGWYVFASATLGYTFNQIFYDGNTFEDSRSVKYRHETLGLSAGVAYSLGDLSLTLAVYNLNAFEHKSDLDDASRFGTFTFAWKA